MARSRRAVARQFGSVGFILFREQLFKQSQDCLLSGGSSHFVRSNVPF